MLARRVVWSVLFLAAYASTCQDEHSDCSSWADLGECDANAGFMMASCKSSCGKCPMTEAERAAWLTKSWFKAAENGNLERLAAIKAENGRCIKSLHPVFGQPALHRTAIQGQAAAAKWLIEACRADPDEREPQYEITPLHIAAVSGSVEVQEVLLAHKANPAPADAFERTPLSIAEGKGHTAFTKALEAYLALSGFETHAYSEEYLEEQRLMDEL